MYSLILSLEYKMAALHFTLTYKRAQVFRSVKEDQELGISPSYRSPATISFSSEKKENRTNTSSQVFHLLATNPQGCQKVFKQKVDNEQKEALELALKTKVLEGQASTLQGYFENQSLGNGVSRGFQEVFSTADDMLFHKNTRKTGNNAVEMSLGVPQHRMVRMFHRSKPV